jgi:molecular chaperone DnaK
VDVDDVAVQRMVEESVEHAFEDLAARKWIEVKLKAEALVTATQKALVEATTELGAEKAKEIESVLNEVMSLTQENSITGIGNTKELELACSRLDEATRPLAQILMDRAMEAVLRERGLLH